MYIYSLSHQKPKLMRFMKKIRFGKIILPFIALGLFPNISNAQDGVYISPSTTVYVSSDMVILGNLVNKGTIETSSDAKITVHGDSLKNVGGTNTGNGVYAMVRPGPAPYYSSGKQYLDGGGSASSFPNLELSNPANVELVTTDTKVRDSLDFGVDGTVVELGTRDLTVGNSGPGKITNYSDQRYVVTDGSGVLVRESVGSTAMDFPVGMAEGDYTPASVANSSGSSDVAVRVDDYSGAGLSMVQASEGIDRFWNIQTSATNGSVDLQHNTATEGATYDNSAAVVTRYIGTDPNTAGGSTSYSLYDFDGSSNTGSGSGTITSGGAIAGASVLSRAVSTNFSTYPWFTKSVSDTDPLDDNSLLLNADVILQGPWNSGASLMNDNLRSAGVIPLTEPYTALSGFNHVGQGGGETANASVFTTTGNNAVVDWVFLELRNSANNTEVMATRAALLQADGDIVEVDNSSPVDIRGLNDASYYIVVRHRNHLGVMTSSTVALSSTAATVDFTNPSTTTYGTNAQVSLTGGVNGLWAGNASSSDASIIYTGSGNDPSTIFNTILSAPGNTSNLTNYILNGYFATDVNMDQSTIYTGANNDPAVIFNNILAHPGNGSNLTNYIITEQLP